MKKLLVVLMIAVLLLTLGACSYVPSTRFMSKSQVRSLEKEFPNPQAELTLDYTMDGQDRQIKIVYDLLLGKAPLATIRFIQLANDGFYNESIIDNYNSSEKYMTLGRYLYKKSTVQSTDEKTVNVYLQNPMDKTFKGEFKSNGYKEPAEGYAQMSPLALAMFHDTWKEDNNTFDSANGYLMLIIDSSVLNPDNYAVFAEVSSVSFRATTDGEVRTYGKRIPSDVLGNLTKSTGNYSRTVYADETEKESTSVSLMTNVIFKVTVRMLGDYNWSKLPSVGR